MPSPQAFRASRRPRAAIFRAAFTFRSCTVLHQPHVHSRTLKNLGPSFAPHAEHTWLVGSNRPILTNQRPCRAALYSTMDMNADHPASCTDFASRVLARPRMHRSSTYTACYRG